MWLVRRMVISKFIRLKWSLASKMLMSTRVEGMAKMVWYTTEVSTFLVRDTEK